MRILIATLGMHFPWVDGRITSLKTLAESWVASGAEVRVLTTGPASMDGEVPARENGVWYRVFPGGNRKNWWRWAGAFFRCCRHGEMDLVVYRPYAGFNAINVAALVAFRLICAVCRVPFVLSLWGGPAQLLKMPWFFSCTLLIEGKCSRSRRVVSVPPLVGMESRGSPGKNKDALWRWGLGDTGHVYLFTYCGKADSEALWDYIMRHRGLGDLIEAAVHLKGEADLKVIVSMPMLAKEETRARLRNLLALRGVEELFVLTHEIEDLGQVLAAVDGYVYPVNLDEVSWAPLSVLEAFACGTPVISTKTAVILRFITDREALLYEPGRADELARLMKRLQTEDGLAERLRSNAMAKLETFSSKGPAVAATLEAFQAIAFSASRQTADAAGQISRVGASGNSK